MGGAKQQSLNMPILEEWQTGDERTSILSLVESLNSNEFDVPHFQREYVWPRDKLISYAKTVMTKQAVGVILTYQLRGGGKIFLADGLQRLTSISRFMANPMEYGFQFDAAQAEKYCKAFKITQQHRIYSDHDEAMSAFHDLNNGTSLVPVEYYKGILTRDPRGKILYEKIPQILNTYEKPIITTVNGNRATQSKSKRDSYALFFQYISGTKQKEFWSVGSSRLGDVNKSLETKLMRYINDKKISLPDLEKLILNFEKFIAREVKEIVYIRDATGQRDKYMSKTFCRYLLHLSLWRKNNNRPVELYKDFVKRLLTEQKKLPGFTTKFALESKEDGLLVNCSLELQSLKDFVKLCELFEIPLNLTPSREKKQSVPGIHNSHIEPFSKNGEGETVLEPGTSNMSRGGRSISENELKELAV